jgi:cytoskeletal protein CcmA (bactofilin family)
MKITNKTKNTKRLSNYRLAFYGNLISDEEIIIDAPEGFVVYGDLKSKGAIISNGNLIVMGYIDAGQIKVKGSLTAAYSIFADQIEINNTLTADSISSKGDIIVTDFIKSHRSIYSSGNIITDAYIKADEGSIGAGNNIKAKLGITAAWNIIAGGSIESGIGIVAGWEIKANNYISANNRIFAGINSGNVGVPSLELITCAELKKGSVCNGKLNIEEPYVTMSFSEVKEKLGINKLIIK